MAVRFPWWLRGNQLGLRGTPLRRPFATSMAVMWLAGASIGFVLGRRADAPDSILGDLSLILGGTLIGALILASIIDHRATAAYRRTQGLRD